MSSSRRGVPFTITQERRPALLKDSELLEKHTWTSSADTDSDKLTSDGGVVLNADRSHAVQRIANKRLVMRLALAIIAVIVSALFCGQQTWALLFSSSTDATYTGPCDLVTCAEAYRVTRAMKEIIRGHFSNWSM